MTSAAPLGEPLGPAREVHEIAPVTVLDWSAGQDPRAFVLDAATATPEGLLAEVDQAGPWQRAIGTRLSQLRLLPGKTYHIEAECEVIRRPAALQFNVRTPTGGWWIIDATVVPDDFLDYNLEWHLVGPGAFRLTRLRVQLMDDSYLRRDFQGGSVFLNTTPYPITVKLPSPLRRLQDEAAPRYIIEVDDQSPDFACQGAWEELAGECGYVGRGYRQAAKPGDTARWSFTAPADDDYTLFITSPGGETLTDAAVYAVTTNRGQKRVPLDQRAGDGGWLKLTEVSLGEGATIADAIRVESAARYNDGAEVTEFALEPAGGAVLVRP